ncbi:MAG: glycosyltransferase family 4 protein [Gammaproteobacteria bacterium]
MNLTQTDPTPRVVVVVSHPIQHFVPFYRALAASGEIDLRVIYASRIGLERYFDRDMNTAIEWKMDLLSGYEHVFLPEAPTITHTSPRSVYNPSIGDELARSAPDAVLIYGYNYRTSRMALDWCRKHRVPAIMVADSELKAPRSLLTRAVKAVVLPRVLARFHAFVTVGDCNEDYYAHYGVPRGRMFRSPFTIDEVRYREARARRAALRAARREAWKVGEHETLVLTVGKVNERKRTADVIDAAARCRDLAPANPLRFVIAGNGVEFDALTTRARAENLPVLLLGFVNVDELPAVYAACDLIAHPSSRDPHPLVMSEAACIGLPLVVSSRVGAVGPTDIARAGENALVFPCGEVAALAEAVGTLAEDRVRLARMGQRSREIFDELDTARSVRGLVDAVHYCMRSAAA